MNVRSPSLPDLEVNCRHSCVPCPALHLKFITRLIEQQVLDTNAVKTVLSCCRCLINTGVKKEQHLKKDYNFVIFRLIWVGLALIFLLFVTKSTQSLYLQRGNGIACFKNVKHCLNTNIYSYLETSGGQSSNAYLNVVNFFNTRVD